LEYDSRQENLFCWKIDVDTFPADYPGMAARNPKPFKKLYLGQWLARLGRKPAEIARSVGVEPSYISNLISGKKANPSGAILVDIAEELGLSANDLYRMPPPKSATEAVEALNPSQIATLGRLLDEMKDKGRK
jgi:transcriptional regulator with XRE-family HTH domain